MILSGKELCCVPGNMHSLETCEAIKINWQTFPIKMRTDLPDVCEFKRLPKIKGAHQHQVVYKTYSLGHGARRRVKLTFCSLLILAKFIGHLCLYVLTYKMGDNESTNL